MENVFGEGSDSFSSEKVFDLKKIFYRVLGYWYILLICVIISLFFGVYIHKSTAPLYKVSASLLITDDAQQMPSIGSAEGALPGVNMGAYSNIENQLVILTSTQQIENALRGLNLVVNYYEKATLREIEIYKDCPFIINLETAYESLVFVKYNLKFIDDKTFVLSKEGDNKFSKKYTFFEKIELEGNVFSVLPDERKIANSGYMTREFAFQINSRAHLINYYQTKTLISNLKRGSSVYEISLMVNNVAKGKDFINSLAQNSVNYTLEKKNQIANNTIAFIDNQLIGVSDSLSAAKSVLENFRSRNEMMDVSIQGQLIIDKTQVLQDEKNALQSQLQYYDYLVDYLETGKDFLNLLPPAAYGVDNDVLTQMVGELSTLNSEKESLKFNSKVENPQITMINRRIETLKRSILEMAKSSVISMDNAIAEVDDRLMKLSRDIRRLPKKERMLLEIENKFQSTDRMYTYLMERRSDAQLAKASNTPDNEIVEYARFMGQVKPSLKEAAIVIILIGLFLPAAVIFIIVFANGKVLDKDDLERVSDLPIIGTLPNVKKGKVLDALLNPRSVMAESVRAIRTALDFYPGNDTTCKSILFTSGLPGEGKSSCAVSLAVSYAQLGKKTLLIDFDMRRPTVESVLGIKKNGNGLSRHLAKVTQNDDQHLIESTEIPDLEVIPSGAIPPNPAELIASPKTVTLFEELKRLYDVVVIDSPPIGLVTDAALLNKFADVTILVSRHNVSPKQMLTNLLKEKKLSEIQHLSLLLNDLPVTKRAYNSYSYSSKYYN